MNRRLIAAHLLVILLAGYSVAHGQKQTERYIPVGRSPGLSGKVTQIGTITATDPAARTITLELADRRRTVAVTERTRIWLDRSPLKQATLGGSYGDLQSGRRVEVKYEEPERAGVAEWIKVEIAESDASGAARR
jgi:hypothetical protein